jgi:hypothetical protein
MLTRRRFLICSAAVASTAITLKKSFSDESKHLRDKTNEAIHAAVKYLLERQCVDGAWRSEIYGPLKDGPALTSLIAATLTPIRHRDDCDIGWSKGARYLSNLVSRGEHAEDALADLSYPVYVAAGAVVALLEQPEFRDSRDYWLEHLRSLQLTEQHGWRPSDLAYGGWSYASAGLEPINGSPATPIAVPNLSATVYALDALCAAGVSTCDPAIQKARRFVERCQNWPDDDAQCDPHLDDGGFHFILGDAQRNKAGEVGTDALGRARFASYGSATADGLRALRDCGLSENHRRCHAAGDWLKRNFSADHHPGGYARDREHLRPALYYYYCASAAHALPTSVDAPVNLRQMAAALVGRQRHDGSWANSAVDVREDDPLVATPLAVQALIHCQNA